MVIGSSATFSGSLPFHIPSWLDKQYGEVHKIRRYRENAGGQTIDLPRALKLRWLDRGGRSRVFHICGELSSTFTVEKTLAKNRPMSLVIGDELISESRRDLLAKLLEANPRLLTVYRADSRPEMHGTMIDNNIFIEDWHDFGGQYQYARAIEHAKPKLVSVFMDYFNGLIKGKTPLSFGEVRKVPIRTT